MSGGCPFFMKIHNTKRENDLPVSFFGFFQVAHRRNCYSYLVTTFFFPSSFIGRYLTYGTV